jgi:c-di-GMP-binding flagellar brake protein YcgR
MKPRRLLGTQDALQLFDRAVRERALAVLTLQVGDNWETFKSRFLERDPRGRFFVLDYVAQPGQTLPELAPGQYLGVSFRQASRKLLFATVVEAKGHFVLEDKVTVPAVRYRWPDTMTELQRRAYYRTPVPPDTHLPAAVWAGGVVARNQPRSNTLQVVPGRLADLSCGGALITLDQPQPPDWTDGTTLGLELHLPDRGSPVTLDAQFRGVRDDESGQSQVAVQFVGLEISVDGRSVLQRLSNSVQRLHRLALAAQGGSQPPGFRN